MEAIKRDTTLTMFRAVLRLVKENGHYEDAAAIMDYVLPNERETDINEAIELSNYRFNFNAHVNFGSSEGIYIDCYIDGEYTETPRTRFDHDTSQIVPERHYQIATFKTLRDDIIAMQIMGKLCGSLIFYANRYLNKNLERYIPTSELKIT